MFRNSEILSSLRISFADSHKNDFFPPTYQKPAIYILVIKESLKKCLCIIITDFLHYSFIYVFCQKFTGCFQNQTTRKSLTIATENKIFLYCVNILNMKPEGIIGASVASLSFIWKKNLFILKTVNSIS